jgi:quercetin dioxygenase-like cupin family protein
MALQKKSLDSPEETRPIDKGKIEIVDLGETKVMRTTFEPGWRWSECVKPVAGTDSCQTHHIGYVMSGRLHVEMDGGGGTLDLASGDAFDIPPGHDAWVDGDEAYVAIDFSGGSSYATK